MGEIVAIVSSPHNDGNTTAIVDAITDGAMGLSTNIIRLFRLTKLKSKCGCQGCYRCKSTGKCVLDDDISEVLDRIRTADCVIFSTPVFFGERCAQYRILEDRMFSFLDGNIETNLAPGKKAILVATCSGPVEAADTVLDRMSTIVSSLGFEVMDRIAYSDKGGSEPASRNSDILSKSKAIGLKLRNT